MKKLVIIISLFLSVSLMAQDRAKLQSQVAKSDNEIRDPKKAAQPKTWLSRAETFLNVYEAPTKNLMSGMGNREIKLVLAKERVLSSISEEIFGEVYDIDVYADKKLYYDAEGRLTFWIVTDFAAEKPLLKSLEAYKQTAALDAKGANNKKVKDGLQSLQAKFSYDGYIAYVMQDFAMAAENYKAAIECSIHPLIADADTTAMYMVGISSFHLGNFEKAVEYYKQAIAAGYAANGDIFAEYARTLKAMKDTTGAVDVLTSNLPKYPTNKEMIFALINTFIEKGEDPKKILPYIHQAEESDPHNASVSYVEGIVYEQLNDFEKAEQAYKRAIEKDENFFFAYYNLGVLYYNEGARINNDAFEDLTLSEKAYDAMIELSQQKFKSALAPLEKGYQLNPTERATVDLLKTIYFRLRVESDEMMKKYEHYNELLQSM